MGNKTKQKVYNYIVKYIKENGYAPSVREICQGVGLSSTSSVHNHLKKLQKEGLIEIRGNSPRAIRVVNYKFIKKEK